MWGTALCSRLHVEQSTQARGVRGRCEGAGAGRASGQAGICPSSCQEASTPMFSARACSQARPHQKLACTISCAVLSRLEISVVLPRPLSPTTSSFTNRRFQILVGAGLPVRGRAGIGVECVTGEQEQGTYEACAGECWARRAQKNRMPAVRCKQAQTAPTCDSTTQRRAHCTTMRTQCTPNKKLHIYKYKHS